MDPIAFHLGPIAVHWYGIIIGIAFIIGIYGSARGVRKSGLSEDNFYSMVMWMVIASLIGARMYYVAFQWSYYRLHLSEIIAVWQGGMAIHGGILAGWAVLLIGCQHYKMSFWHLADIIAPFLILGQAIGRWGNFINKEAYGYEVNKADVPWAINIDGAWHHPTFFYESFWDLCGFFLLIYLSRQEKIRRGEVALAYLIYYSTGRFVVESFRTDSLMLGPFRIAQVMSLVLAIFGIGLLIGRRKLMTKSNHHDGFE